MGDGAHVKVLAQDYQHHGKEDEENADDEAGREHFTKDQHTDGHGGQWLQCAQDGCRRSTDMMHGNGHEHQRKNRGYHTQPYGKRPCPRRWQGMQI